MAAWASAFEPHDLITAQILLTRDDTETRRRWLNARATVATLLDMGAVPVVNENDTVATDEIRYGDNDRLAARVAQMIGADLLILLSDVDGLYTADPRSHPEAVHIPHVAALTPAIEAMATGPNAGAGMGTGGMATKLMAARIAADAGCATLIAAGRSMEAGRAWVTVCRPDRAAPGPLPRRHAASPHRHQATRARSLGPPGAQPRHVSPSPPLGPPGPQGAAGSAAEGPPQPPSPSAPSPSAMGSKKSSPASDSLWSAMSPSSSSSSSAAPPPAAAGVAAWRWVPAPPPSSDVLVVASGESEVRAA
jgi:hypothetical protein